MHFSENIEDYDEENKKPLPPYIQMVISIMKRVLHFLPSKNHFISLQVMYIYDKFTLFADNIYVNLTDS
jgi:hypothetical protein